MAKWLDRMAGRFTTWATRPVSELSRTQQRLRWWYEVGRYCRLELRRDRAGQMAAALTYHTMFSLLPTIVLMLVVMAAFVDEDRREQIKGMAVDLLSPPMTEQDQPAGSPDVDVPAPGDRPADTGAAPGPDDDGAASGATDDDLLTQRRQGFDDARQSIDDQIEKLLNTLEEVSFKGIGAIGLLVFIYGATGLLTTIEKSFNIVYDAPRMRPPYLRFPLYFTVIVLGPLVVLAGLSGKELIVNLIQSGAWTGWLAGPLVLALPLLTIWAMLTLVYKLMPHTRVHWRAAIIGAFVSTALWLLAYEGFRIYVVRTAVSTVYGAVFVLPLFLLWLWLTWIIILFGLEVSFTLQHIRRLRFKRMESGEPAVIDAAWLLPLAACIAEAFEQGRTTTIDGLSNLLNLPSRAVQHMIGAMEAAALVQRVDTDDQTAAYTLARPADRITAASVIAVGKSLMPSAPAAADHDATWALVHELRQQSEQGARGTTLAQLIRSGDGSIRSADA
jgi:membrane protein